MTTVTSRFALGPASLTDALFESLRGRIISGDIPPGDKVTEQRIAMEYAVARPTAKSCIERLTGLGLLRRVAHKSAVVPQFTEDEIKDLYFSRETFEAAAVAHLAQIGEVPAATLRAQDLMRRAAHAGDFTDLVVADIEFHWSLVRGLGSERLTRMYEQISGEIHLTMGQFSAHRRTALANVAAEHDAILAAISAGDEAAARTLVTDHLMHARERVLAQLKASSGPAS